MVTTAEMSETDPDTGQVETMTIDGLSWDETGLDALRLALQLWDEVSGLSFTEMAPGTPDLDLNLCWSRKFVMAELVDDTGTLGFHLTPDGSSPAPLPGIFNAAPNLWNEAVLQQGGYSFITLIHEIGHGLGLAHPHDDGGGSQIFPGAGDGGLGLHAMNQGIWTV